VSTLTAKLCKRFLKGAEMPSNVPEYGYLSHTKDRAAALSPGHLLHGVIEGLLVLSCR
jgi:hypothetical protein